MSHLRHTSGLISVSMFQMNGAWIIVVMSVLVALFPVLVVRHRVARIVSAMLLWNDRVMGKLSVGLFFVPAAMLMRAAASRSESASIPPMPAVSAG